MRRATRSLFPLVWSPFVSVVLCVSLFYAPLLALRPQSARAAAPAAATLHPLNFNPQPAWVNLTGLWHRFTGLWQTGVLDTLRGTTPAAPVAYQSNGLLPASTYDDPKPVNTDALLTTAVQPDNATGLVGALPLQAPDPTAGHAVIGGLSIDLIQRRVNFTAPAVNLAGRAGLNLTLALSYSSNVWTTNGSTQVFNVDRGFPGPGWRLGFGALQRKDANGGYSNSVTSKSSLIYLAPDGTRHDLALNGATVLYESYDGTYLQYNPATQELSFPNGTRLKFETAGQSYNTNNREFLAFPTRITDRNGNIISIAYTTLTFGQDNVRKVPDYVIDTAGRRIDFEYQSNRLVAIKQQRDSGVFYYLRLDYAPVTLQTSFSATEPALPNGTQVWLPVRLTYPTGVNLRFIYDGFAQLSGIAKWVPEITGQGAARQIAATALTYDVPSLPTQLRFRTDTAENWQGGTYTYLPGQTGMAVTDTLGRRYETTIDGLTVNHRVFAPGSSSASKRTITTYEQDANLSYRSNPRVTATEIWDQSTGGPTYTVRKSSTEYQQFYGMWLPVRQNDQPDGQGGAYRYTLTTYYFPSQRILGLPATVELHKGNGALLSKVQNTYDQTGSFTDANNQPVSYLANEAGVVQHDTTYDSNFTARGNLTSVAQFKVDSPTNESRIVKRVFYDTSGNVRGEADALGQRKQLDYTDNYVDKPANLGPTQLYPTLMTSPDTAAVRGCAQFYYHSGLTKKTYNLLPNASTEEQVVTTSYDFADRPWQTTKPDGGWVRTDYWDNLLAVGTAQQLAAGKVRFKWELSDGAGQVYKKASDHPEGVSGKYAGQLFVFDTEGRVKDSSNVLAVNGSFTPTAEDANASWLFTTMSYDDFSRVIKAKKPDNNEVTVAYEGCGCAGNMSRRVTDELGNYTETKTDLYGRLAEAVEPGPGADGIYSKAVYTYDELDRLVQIDHTTSYNSNLGVTPKQTRAFNYDGWGQLSSETTPEAGTVSYVNNANGQLTSSTNANGKSVNYLYNARNLPTAVSYSDNTPAVGYQYDAYGARTQMTDGEGQTTYAYNSYRQLQSETRTFTGLPGQSYALSYAYNQADQLTQVVYSGTQSAGEQPASGVQAPRTQLRPPQAPPRRASGFGPLTTAARANLSAASNLALLAQAAHADFDGDGKTDLSVWRGSEGNWYVKRSSDGSSQVTLWGSGVSPYNDVIVPGKYDGDSKTDHAVWRPSDGNWYIKRSSDGQTQTIAWGNGVSPYYDVPVPGDYDGDGKTDAAIWRPGDGTWYIKRSSDNQTQTQAWGGAGDMLVPSDYDGDGKTDIAIWRPSDGNWYIKRSSDNQSQVTQWGSGAAQYNDLPVPADYDGDGKTDLAYFRRANSTWYILKSSNNATQTLNWGAGTDRPAPGDYDGDGKADIAVWRPSNGTWYIKRSSDNASVVQAWGGAGDTPVPASGVPQPPAAGALSLSGQVTNTQGGGGLSGVVITLSGAQGMQTVTDANGQYSFTGLASGSYIVSPGQSGYSISPGSRSYPNLTANVSDADFTGVALPPPAGLPFSKTINYAYNNVGALAGVGANLIGTDATNTTNVINNLQFKAFGAIRQLNYGNGLQLTMGYNANRQQPISMKVGPNGTGTILNYSYEYYDASGHNNNRIRRIVDGTDSGYTVDYTYDQWNRLTHATAGAYTRYYTYDAFGNLKTATGTGGSNPNYTLNYAQNSTTAPATNRILSVTENGVTQPFTYDNAGNLTQGDGMTYAYDAANRLKEVSAGALGQYGYDGDGMRVQKMEGGVTTHYVRSSKLGQVAFEMSNASLQRAYVYFGNRPLAELSSDGQFYWLHRNHQGNVQAMTNTAGGIMYKGQFDPQGQALTEWSATGTPNLNAKKFTGYERDAATGLDYANARQYKSNRGRFMQPDPSGLKGADLKRPESLNRYSYVEGDLVNSVDANGLMRASICYVLIDWTYWTAGDSWWITINNISTACTGGAGEPEPGAGRAKNCPANFEKQVVVANYLLRAGLDGEDANSSPIATVRDSNNGAGFIIDFKPGEMAKVLAVLGQQDVFSGGGSWGSQYHQQELRDKFKDKVGDLGDDAQFRDYRSLTIGDKALGGRSLQVTLYSKKGDPDNIIGAFVDTDSSNYSEDVVSLVKHLGSMIGGFFKGKCE